MKKMYKIITKKELNPTVTLMEIAAPHIAKKAKAGQFIILRIDEKGERIPLTIADYDEEKGTVTIIFQIVGSSTSKLNTKKEGESILDFVGPLGTPSHLDGIKSACVIGGGLGTAIAYPQAKALHKMGAKVDVITGFKNDDLIILKDEIAAVSDNHYITTDDKGFVTDVLKDLLERGNKYDMVIAIGPLVMMKAVCDVTKPYGIKTIVSMNSIMIDGTGMCGGCRLTVGGETKFARVDGPDFDGHLVDFDEAIRRSYMYKEQETCSRKEHNCRLEGMR